jgi:hypothetical protein
MIDMPTHDDFMPYLEGWFHFEGWHGTLRLTKVDVRSGQQRPGAPHPPFTLIFTGPRDDILREGTYVARAGDGPGFIFHIIPIHTPAPNRQDYQVVFN